MHRDIQIVLDYGEGLTEREIASLHGVSHMTVHRVLNAANVVRRAPGRRRKADGLAREQRYYASLKDDPQKLREFRERRYLDLLKAKYKLTPQQYFRMLDEHGEGCAVCGRQEPKGKRLAVDHCHRTGIVRGLLCSRCNLVLGTVADDVKLLKAIVKYLTKSTICTEDVP